MTQLKVLIKHGLICNIHSTLMVNTHHGKLLVIKLPDIFITLTEVMLFSIFHHHHSEDKFKTTISSLLNLFGTGMLLMVKSLGTPAVLLLLMPIILSAHILKELIAILEANVKREILILNKDGLYKKFKKYFL